MKIQQLDGRAEKDPSIGWYEGGFFYPVGKEIRNLAVCLVFYVGSCYYITLAIIEANGRLIAVISLQKGQDIISENQKTPLED